MAGTLTACGGQSGATGGGLAGPVRIDGSSTVEPLSSAASELFSEVQPQVNVSVGSSGTGGGFEAFCAGRTDISNASRPIEPEEKGACEQQGVEYTELVVANDALTVVVNPDVDWVDCVTVDQLNTIWGPRAEGEVTNWSDVDPGWPDQRIVLFGPGTDSGTFDYFTAAVNGEEGASRSDYEASEDDNVLVEGVANTSGAMGYFGFTYYEENADSLKALQVDGGDGCVEPSVQTAQSGEYAPLSRPLFIYVNEQSYADKPQVKAFVDFYAARIDRIVEAAQYIPLNAEQLAELEQDVERLGR
ncbi:MAG: PstS family phosphate ABC transporter substrate-binding protein [Actinomycetota bacterium]|nr:PstS family phosphate ABC transporter substrate-binding protein [Actinomycetota bacterium]